MASSAHTTTTWHLVLCDTITLNKLLIHGCGLCYKTTHFIYGAVNSLGKYEMHACLKSFQYKGSLVYYQIISFIFSLYQSALANGVYEEVKDTCISEDVYAEAQLPTNPCTNPTYSTVQFPISHGGDPAYSTGQSPADHPSYASVTFRKNPSSNDDSVTLNKDEIACDYATVSCPSPSTQSYLTAFNLYILGQFLKQRKAYLLSC